MHRPVTVTSDENDLFWSELQYDFFDMTVYAGEGNIGHILMMIREHWQTLIETDQHPALMGTERKGEYK